MEVPACRASATSSNCGEFLKPSATKQPPKGDCGRGNDLGYGNNALDATMDDPQPSAKGPGLCVQFND